MALIVILFSIVLTVLAFALGLIIPKTNEKIKHLVNAIRLSYTKPMFVGAVILIVSASISAIYSIVSLFSQYNANWVSNSTSLLSALSQAIALTILLLYISLGIAILKRSSVLLLVSPSLILLLTLLKKVYFDTSSFSNIYRDYFIFLPTVAVMLSLLVVFVSTIGLNDNFIKYNRLIKIAPWTLLLPILNNAINIISTQTFHISTAINCVSAVLNTIAFIYIFKPLIDSIENLSTTSNKKSITTKEKWIVVLSIILFPLIINRISSISKVLLLCTTFVVAIFLVIAYKATEKENTKVRKNALIITAIIVILICIISTILPSNNNSSSCGHPACEENGPFPCYGKNNTCPNYTDCYKDLYCDECD